MASKHTTLDAASTDRKARLAKLAALKRKQPDTNNAQQTDSKPEDDPDSKADDVTSRYLSGRNYDPESKGPKLGFENDPKKGMATLEDQASQIVISTTEASKDEEETDKPIDLFKLQPKKPNWDLKRDLDEKMKILNVRTENAIARLVRERIQNAQKTAKSKDEDKAGDQDSEEIGMEGEMLVEGVHAREREEEEEKREMTI